MSSINVIFVMSKFYFVVLASENLSHANINEHGGTL